jgi:hypothetical protein
MYSVPTLNSTLCPANYIRFTGTACRLLPVYQVPYKQESVTIFGIICALILMAMMRIDRQILHEFKKTARKLILEIHEENDRMHQELTRYQDIKSEFQKITK